MASVSGPRRTGRKKIPDSQRLAAWVRSGGRCVICNKDLLQGGMTYREVSLGELAHIVGQRETPGSPRGLAGLVPDERDKADNLMLLCGDEHHEIDAAATLDIFAVERLRDLKQRHEDRIHHVTGLGEDRSTTVIRMIAPVRGRQVELTRATTAATVLTVADRFPRFLESYHRHGVEIDLRHVPGEAAAGPAYYETATARVDEVIGMLNGGLTDDNVAHLSVFAFARIPLLAYLGSQLDDTIPTDIYQRHRVDESWKWSTTSPAAEFSLDVINDVSPQREAVLVLNVSGTIQVDEIPHSLTGHMTYELVPNNITAGPDILRNRAALANFELRMRELLSSLEANAKTVRRLHVLPAIPLSAAVALGRIRDPQVHPAFLMYDRTDSGYEFALEIA
jgi:hypothetical protein